MKRVSNLLNVRLQVAVVNKGSIDLHSYLRISHLQNERISSERCWDMERLRELNPNVIHLVNFLYFLSTIEFTELVPS